MMNKFTYFDVISNLLPGLVLVWALPILGPLDKNTIPILLTGNTIVDPILLVAICYVIGQFLQFFSKYSIEPLLKKAYWKGYFFSDIFLIPSFKQCSHIEWSRFISCAENKLDFSKEDLLILFDKNISSDCRKLQKAIEVSIAVFRAIDAKTSDSSKAQKAHLQNTFYSLFRNLSGLFFLLIILDLIEMIKLKVGLITESNINIYILLINVLLTIVFLIRSRERGELYVRGLFWSFCHGNENPQTK
jgi:hypothetical protein